MTKPASTTSFESFLKLNGPRNVDEIGQLKRAIIGLCSCGQYTVTKYSKGVLVTGKKAPSLWLASEDAVEAFKRRIRLKTDY